VSRYRLAEQAKLDLSEIWEYIGAVRGYPAAAHRQLEILYEKFTRLARQPLMGQLCDNLRPGLRAFSAGAYVIFYVPIRDGIEVERVIHGVRDISSLF
jgi:toxin ParE1/3/4